MKIVYTMNDFQINEKPLDHVPDPFKIIANHEIEKKLHMKPIQRCFKPI